MAPGDPVDSLLSGGGEPTTAGDFAHSERVYEETVGFLGLHKPVFYLHLSSIAFPDTLYRIVNQSHRKNLNKLIQQYGNWPEVEQYYHELKRFQKATYDVETEASNELVAARTNLKKLYTSYNAKVVSSRLDTIHLNLLRDPELSAELGEDIQRLKEAYNRILLHPTRWKLYVPDIKWNGWDNQYHNWFLNFVQGDFGISFKDSRPVSDSVWDALKRTLLLNIIALFLAYLLSIPLGVFSAVKRDSIFDQTTTLVLFILYSLPTFWIGTLLLVFFTTPEYGMNWFPSSGLGDLPASAPFWAPV